MSVHLQHEVGKLKLHLLALSAQVESMLLDAVRALDNRDLSLASQVISRDDAIDRTEVEIEEECLKILALHQPVAGDLRFIIAVLKINNDLERTADLAVNIAERARQLASLPPVDAPFNFHAMAEKATRMVNMSLDSLIRHDAGMARQVIAADNEIDALHGDMYNRVAAAIAATPAQAPGLLQLMSVSRNLERIADHATNIAEDVIYMHEGEIVRHQKDQPRS